MAFSPFKKIRVPPNTNITDKQINAVQDNISFAVSQVLGKDQLDSILITNVVLVPGIVNKVSHTLGRSLNGWYVVRNHGQSVPIIDQQDTNKAANLLLYLTVPTKCMVDLIVF